MSYIQRNVINGIYTTTSQWKTSMMQAIVDAIAAQGGWTTLETGYADGTYTRWVFKSPANDFCAVFFYTTANASNATSSVATSLYFTVCETYDNVGHTLTKQAMCRATTLAAAADHSVGSATDSLATTISTYGVGFLGLTSSVTMNSYAISVFTDGIAIISDMATGSGGTNSLYIGNFTSLVINSATNDPVRVCVAFNSSTINTASNVNNNGSANNNFGVTRSAMNGSKAAHSWINKADSWLNTLTYTPNNISITSLWDQYQGGTGQVYAPLYFARTAITDITTFGYLRGLIPHWYATASLGLLYDTATIGATTYVSPGFTAGGAFQGAGQPVWMERG